jgi:membrane-associated phospholipid phosphatase
MPQFKKMVNADNRIPTGLVLLAWVILTYYLPNNYLILNPFPVPATFVDQWIGLSPSWVWAYVSYYFYLAGAYLFVRDEQNLNQVVYSYAFSTLIAFFIFFLLPTSLPRFLYPLENPNTWAVWMLNHVRGVDQSINCAPSMHITMSTIAALTYYKESKKMGVLTALWGLLIAYSTMATKQHYFWDVVTGFIFGLATYGFFSRAKYTDEFIFSSTTANS